MLNPPLKIKRQFYFNEKNEESKLLRSRLNNKKGYPLRG